MIYCMSDIHGDYVRLKATLDTLNLQPEDTLYILGDLCDRGDQNIEVLNEVMSHPNIKCILGNHDKMLMDYIYNYIIKDDSGYVCSNDFYIWMANGGHATYNELVHVDYDYLKKVYSYLKKLPLYEIIANNILVHAGTYAHSDADDIIDYMKEQNDKDLLWARPMNGMERFYNRTELPVKFIVGHTPTKRLSYPKKDETEIVEHGNTLFIDCGVCIRLDDLKVMHWHKGW